MRRHAKKPSRAAPVASAPGPAPPRIPSWLLAVLLALVTVASFWPAVGCDFIYYDDQDYVTENARVQQGLTLENMKWSFLNPVSDHWHPLTVLSHMLGCQLFGLNPWGHHLINVLFHALNAALVFALLQKMTGARWRSLFVAALFAIHPLRVESVAWVSERKDVLSGFFGLLSLLFYARYAQRRKTANCQLPTANSYLLALFFFALGLMSKPMLVTWPFVMLLLDYWPLNRFQLSTFSLQLSALRRLLFEKIPFFALAAAGSVATFVAQKHGGSLRAAGILPLGARAGNALISYCRHLEKMFWPVDLAVFYPHPGYWPLTKVLLAGGLLAGVSSLLFVNRRRYPFMLMGFLWFVGMLVPVIGLVQTGKQALADRHTYLPSLGLLILVVWGVIELTRRWRYQGRMLSVAGIAAIILCMALTRQQLGYWRDGETLFRHATAVTENNYVALDNLGFTLGKKGRFDDEISQYLEVIRLKPDYVDAHYNLGNALRTKGRFDEAILQYQEAIRLEPDRAESHNNLGAVFAVKGRLDEAIRQFQEAIRLKPDYPQAINNLARALAMKGVPLNP